jgi:hypothetical protein
MGVFARFNESKTTTIPRGAAWLLAVTGVVALGAACGDKKSPTASTPTVQTVAVTVSPSSLPVQGGEADVTATVTSSAGAPMPGQAVTFTASKGTLTPSTPVTTDGNGQAKAKLSTTESGTVRASVGSINSPDVAVSVKAAVSITTTLDPIEPVATQATTITVSARRSNADVSGKLRINYGNGDEIDHGDINGSKTVEYTYRNSGAFNLSVVVEEGDGSSTRDTQRINVKDAPRSTPPGNGLDDINAKSVRWFVDCDISDWPIQERVLNVSISSSEICVDYTGRGSKPTFDIGIPVDGTVWVFAQFGGVWYGATWDHLRPGTFCKAENAHTLGSEQINRPPMDGSWVPRSGDQVGFMVSGGYVRRTCDPQTVWRTNIELITWP